MRLLFRFLLIASLLIALSVVGLSFWRVGPTAPSAWALAAAGLAVIAAVASAWTSQRVLEIQEDLLAPNPVPMIDMRRRYQLAQFRIVNHGGGTAHDVKIVWERQLRDSNGQDVLLARDVAIPVIPEGESASVVLGSSHSFITSQDDTTCEGTIEYRNVAGRKFQKSFVVSAEHERAALTFDEEGPRTLRELQKLPEKMEKVARAIQRLEGSVKHLNTVNTTETREIAKTSRKDEQSDSLLRRISTWMLGDH